MNNFVNFDVSFRRPDVFAGGPQNYSAEESKLEKIRRLSNVVQSLENVLNQSEDQEEYAGMRKVIENFLIDSRRQLRREIHLD